VARTLGSFRQPNDQGDQPDREIDEEDPAPAHRDQNPADELPSAAATPPAAVHVRTAPLRPSGGKADSGSPSDVGVMSARPPPARHENHEHLSIGGSGARGLICGKGPDPDEEAYIAWIAL